MAKFRKCEYCEHCCYEYEDGCYVCNLFGYDIKEDKNGNLGCYRSDKTINKILKKIKEYEND